MIKAKNPGQKNDRELAVCLAIKENTRPQYEGYTYTNILGNKSVYRGGNTYSNNGTELDKQENDFAAPLPYGNTYIDTTKLNWDNKNGFDIQINDSRFVWVSSKLVDNKIVDLPLEDINGTKSTATPFGKNTPKIYSSNGGNDSYIAYVGELKSYLSDIKLAATDDGKINEITPPVGKDCLYSITYFDAVTLKDGSKGDLVLKMKKVILEGSININSGDANYLKDKNKNEYSYDKAIVSIQSVNSLGVNVDQKDDQNNFVNKYETVAMTKAQATTIIDNANNYLDAADKLPGDYKTDKKIRHAIGGIYDLEIQVLDKDGKQVEGNISYSSHDLDFGTHQNIWGRNVDDENRYMYNEGMKIVSGSKSYAIVPDYAYDTTAHDGHNIANGWIPISPTQTLNPPTVLPDSLLNIEIGDGNNANGVRFSSMGIINIRDVNGKFEDVPFDTNNNINTGLGDTYNTANAVIKEKVLANNQLRGIVKKLYYGRAKAIDSTLTSYSQVNAEHIYKVLGDASWKIEVTTENNKSYDAGFAVLLDAKGSVLQWSGSRQSGAGINTTLFDSSLYTYVETSHGTGGGIYLESYNNNCSAVLNEGAITMGRDAETTITIVPEDNYRVENIYIGDTNYGKTSDTPGLNDYNLYVIDGNNILLNDVVVGTFNGNKTVDHFDYLKTGIVNLDGFHYNEKGQRIDDSNLKIIIERNEDGTIDVTLPLVDNPMHVHAEFAADYYFHKIWVGDTNPGELDFFAIPYHLQYTFNFDIGDGVKTYKMMGNKIIGNGKSWDVVDNIWTILDEHGAILKQYRVVGNEIFDGDDITTMSEQLIVDHDTDIVEFTVDENSPLIYEIEENGEGKAKQVIWHITYPSDGAKANTAIPVSDKLISENLAPMPIEEFKDIRHDRNHTDRLYWFVSEYIPEWALEEYFNDNNEIAEVSIAPGVVSNDYYKNMNWYLDSTAGRDYAQDEININKTSAYMSVFKIGGRIINTPAVYVEAKKTWDDDSNKYNSRKDIVLHIDRVLNNGSQTTIVQDILPPQLIPAPVQGETVKNEYTVLWGYNKDDYEYKGADPNKEVISNSKDLDHGTDLHPITYTRDDRDGSFIRSDTGVRYYINELSTQDINGNLYTYTIRETYVDGSDINVDVVYDDPDAGLLGYTTTIVNPDFSKDPTGDDYGDNVPVYLGEILNEYTYIDIDVTKLWDDNDDQDGYRNPVTLVLDGLDDYDLPDEQSREFNVGVDNNKYQHKWYDLPKYADGVKVDYKVIENDLDEQHYSLDEDIIEDLNGNQKITLTNTHIPETASISIFKKWDDDNNRDDLRKEAAKVLLEGKTASESQYSSVTDQDGQGIVQGLVPVEDGLIISWMNIPVKRNGEDITYKIYENVEGLGGYYTDPTYVDETFTLTNNENKEATIINIQTPELTEVTITKKWNDMDNHDGIRPDSVTVQLVKTYKKISEVFDIVNKEVTVNGEKYVVKISNDLTYYFVKDGKYYNGEEDLAEVDGVVEEYEELIPFNPVGEPVMVVKTVVVDSEEYLLLITAQGIEYYIVLVDDETKYYDPDGNELTIGEDDFNPDPSDDFATEPMIHIYNDQEYEVKAGILGSDEVYYYQIEDKYYDLDDKELIKFVPSEDDEIALVEAKDDPVYDDEVEKTDYILNEDNEWTVTIKDLYVNEPVGQKIIYSVEEKDVPEEYEAIVSSTKPGKFIVTNKHEVIINPPTAEPDETENWRGLTQIGHPTFTADPDTKAPGGGENKIVKITLLDEDGNEVNEVTVPGEGKYVLNEDGTVTFTPEPDFVGKAGGVRLRGYDSNGLSVETTYTPTVKMKVEFKDPLSDDPDTPVDEGVTKKDKTGKDVTTTYEDQPGKESKNHPGYIFEGWDEEEVFDEEEGIKIVRKARYTPYYKISYYPNGGSGTMQDDIYRADDPTMPSKDNEFTRTGYTFTGFTAEIVKPDGTIIKIDKIFKNAEEMKDYFKDMPPGTELKMTAQWKRNEYKISYNPNGGYGKMDPQYFNGDDTSAISKPNSFVRDGYTFTGFKAVTKDGKSIGVFTSPEDFIKYLHEQGDGGEIILIAQWKQNSSPDPEYIIPRTGI